MKKRNCKRIAIALAAASMLQLSVQAAEGTAELIQSDAFSDAADILSNTLAELGDSFTLETEEDFTLSEEKSLQKSLARAKARTEWDTQDVLTMYRQGYTIKDIDKALRFSSVLDMTPYELLEQKGQTTYDVKELDEAQTVQTFSADEPETAVQYETTVNEKSWETVLGEVTDNTAAANPDMQFLRENGLAEFIEPEALTDSEWEYINSKQTAEEETAALAASSTSSDNAIIDAYNNFIFPEIKYTQYNAGHANQNEEVTINPLTHNLTVRAADLSLPGKNGLDLNLTRVNSSMNNLTMTPIVSKSQAGTVSSQKTFYSVTGSVQVTVYYREPLANGQTQKTFDSDTMLFKLTTEKLGVTSSYYMASKAALTQDRERLAEGRMPRNMVESRTDAEKIRQDAVNGKYNRSYYFDSNCKIAIIKFTTFDDPDIYTINSEGTHTIYSDTTGLDIFCTDFNDETVTSKYFDIGVGWEFDFPYIERLYPNSDGYGNAADYLHYGAKGVYRITDDNKLEGYYTKDITLTSGERFQNQNSYYTLTEKNGKKYHFGNLGQLLGIEDRFGNKIQFFYSTKSAYRHNYPYQLTKIIDSVGREINFDYTNPLQTVVSIADPEDSTSIRTIKYNKTAQTNGIYTLSSVLNTENEETVYQYRYTFSPASISLLDKDPKSKDAISIPYYSLEYIVKPSGQRMFFYGYTSCGNYGRDGVGDKLVATRYETQRPKTAEALRYITVSRFTSSSNGLAYDGYPNFRNNDEIPRDMVLRSVETFYTHSGQTQNHVKEYTLSAKKNWICTTYTQSSESSFDDTVLSRERTEYTYNNLEQCIKSVQKKFHDPAVQSSYQSITTEYTYDSAGYNDLIKVKRYGDEEYSISYEYDSTYHLPTKQTQKQNADTTLRSISTLTADKKAVAEKKLTANNATQRKRQYSYDSAGNVISEKRFTGKNSWNDFMEIQYSYDGASLTGITVDGVKNSDGALIPAADGSAAGEVTYAYDYDYFGNIISETDGNGNTYTYSYDGLNRPVLLTNPENGTIGISYHTAVLDTYVDVTNENGNTMRYSYYCTGELAEEKDLTADKVLKGYAYEYGGDDKEGTKITATVYSDYGNQSATATHIDAYGRTLETYTTDSAGNVVYHEQYLYETAVDNLYDRVTRTVKGETAEKDRITRQYTDQYGNLVKEETVTKDADGAEVSYATEYTYDYLGNRLTVKSPRAAAENWEGNLYSAQYEYDAAGQVTKTTDIYGNVTTAEYDGLGQMIRTADAEANAAPTPYYSTLTYDVLGRLLMRQDPVDANTTAETRYDYDRNGNNTRTRVKNGANSYAETSTQYNWRGKPEKALTAGTDTAYFYDPAGNALRMYTGELENLAITGLDQASGADFHVTQYAYDTQNRVLSTTDALGKTESYLYDRNGNLMQTTDRKGQIIGYTYDALGNLTEKSARQNASAEKENIYTYTYNQFGQRTQMSGTDQTSDYLYDNLGRMIKETLTGGVTKEYTYDIANNRTGFVLRNGDETYPMSMQYTYDKLNRVSRITSGNILTDYTYNRNGAISSEQIGDVTTSYQYNRAGWITDLTSQTSAKTIQSHHYQYLPDGNVSAKESTVNAGTTNYSYLYDNAGRLTQEQIGSRQQAYQYDPYGNRSQMTVMDQESYSTSYTYDQNNRLLYEIKTTAAKSEQTTYQYDDNGNLSSWFKGTLEERAATPADESASYTYDAYNRLTDFSRSNSNVCHYGYNGDNLRIFKDVNGYIRKKSYWDGSNLAAEIQANVVYKYYHGLTGIIFSKTASVLSGYYYKNAHGDVTAVADDNQNVTQTYTYDAFGNQLSQSNNDTNPFRYCGEYFDTESNQIYLRNRYYDTATGRFITEDPIRDGANWYGYCGNNPIAYVDPNGTYYLKRNGNGTYTITKDTYWTVFNRSLACVFVSEAITSDLEYYFLKHSGGSTAIGDTFSEVSLKQIRVQCPYLEPAFKLKDLKDGVSTFVSGFKVADLDSIAFGLLQRANIEITSTDDKKLNKIMEYTYGFIETLNYFNVGLNVEIFRGETLHRIDYDLSRSKKPQKRINSYVRRATDFYARLGYTHDEIQTKVDDLKVMLEHYDERRQSVFDLYGSYIEQAAGR